jgi:magnesium-transporting ATPase (P-type)
MQQIGKYIIVTGIIILIIGLVLYFAGNKLQWFGNLPGDIKIKRENFRLYAPITSMILISAVLSFILWIISKIKQ